MPTGAILNSVLLSTLLLFTRVLGIRFDRSLAEEAAASVVTLTSSTGSTQGSATIYGAASYPDTTVQRRSLLREVGCGDANILKKIGLDNEERGSPFACDEGLTSEATAWAVTMCESGVLSHEGFGQRCADAGVSGGCAENVAANGVSMPGSVEFVHNQWMNSTPHAANIQNEKYTVVGYGYHVCGERTYWCGMYAGRGNTSDVLESDGSTNSSETSSTANSTNAASKNTCSDENILKKINLDIEERGTKVTCHDGLTEQAGNWSEEQCRQRQISHDGFSSRCTLAGVSGGCAENVAFNYRPMPASVAFVHTQWIDSPQHAKNIMNQNFTVVGYGYHECDDGNTYWTGMYAGK